MIYVAVLINALVCFGIPIGGLIYMIRKYKVRFRIFLLGVLAFTLSQICFRIPLLQMVCPRFGWFQILKSSPVAYGIFLGITAGIVEEGARLIAMKFFMKNTSKTMEQAVVFGLGHGGIEAMLLSGVPVLLSMISVIGIGMSSSVLSATGIFLGSLERVYAMTFHVGASLIVMYGIAKHRSLLYTVLAILLHMVLDAAIVILPAIFGANGTILMIYGIIISVITFIIGVLLFVRNKKLESLKEW